MTPAEYDFLRQFLKARSGLSLSAEKHYLVEGRLLPIARKSGLTDMAGLVGALRRPDAVALATEVVEAMTTNESYFFRDRTPFEQFRDVMLPALRQSRAASRRIRIWCAAAAAGQEPYSLAMSLREVAREWRGWQFEIVATDLSTSILERARSGLYSQFEVQRGLPVRLLIKYFAQAGERWQLVPELRDMVQFRPLNLLHDFSRLGPFDVVFCRNVLIYFDQPAKTDVLNRLAGVTAGHGYLVLGAAETVVGLTDAFAPIPGQRGLYAPAGASATGIANVICFADAAGRVRAASGAG